MNDVKVYQGIDISRHNIVTDWAKVKSNVDFIILRAGGCYNGYYKDSKFELYYNACKMYNIPVGAYYDAGKAFIGDLKGKECADHFTRLLSGKQFEYPVFVDIEVTPKRYKYFITQAAIAFCEYMEDRRFFVGIYGSDISTFKEQLDIKQLEPYSKWVARYGNKPEYVKQYQIHQYSSTGHIPGINGNVDLDKTLMDYEQVMKGVHLNGY